MARNQQIKHQAMTHYEFILGPVKIKDGLFMGDQLAAKDIEFIISNKVTHVINTVSKQIPNLWERFGIQYLSVNWTQKELNIFDKKNNAVNAIFHFIEEAMEQGESCLVHSVNGKSRACTVIAAYLMKKYNWSLDKCLEFVNTKKEHLEIRNGFLIQLQDLEKRLMQIYNLTGGWTESKNEEDLVLKNTFVNSKPQEPMEKGPNKPSTKKVSFAEKNHNKFNNTLATTGFKTNKETNELKPILKESKYQKDNNTQQINKLKESNFISNINGNIVHVTVNNFIHTDKKPQNVSKTMANVRPFSSDTKERDKKPQNKTRVFAYDNIINSSPYDTKFINKINSNNKLKKKEEETNHPFIVNQRPQSANISGQRRKIKNPNAVTSTLKKQETMMVTGKKRYPSTNPRQEVYKWK